MFEGVVVDAVTQLLGDYLEGLDREKVKVAAWSGNLNLHDLRLRPDAIPILSEACGVDLPVYVSESSVDKLEIKIPWKNLQSSPVVVRLHNVAVLVKAQSEGGADILEQGRARRKRAQLDADHALRVSSWADAADDSSENDGSSSIATTLLWRNRLTARLMRKVIDNMQLELSKVTVVYETAIPETGGFSILKMYFERLKVESTDAKWVPSFVNMANAAWSHKLLSLHTFQASLSPSEHRFESGASNSADLRKKLREASGDRSLRGQSALIAPLNATVRVVVLRTWKLAAAQVREWRRSQADVQVEVMIPTVDAMLDEFQYVALFHLCNEIVSLQSNMSSNFDSTTPKGRWLCALERALPGFSKRREQWIRQKPDRMRQWRSDLIAYVNARREFLNSRRYRTALSKEVQDALQSLEDRLDVQDVLVFRNLTDREMQLSNNRPLTEASIASTMPKGSPTESYLSSFSNLGSALQSGSATAKRMGKAAYGHNEVHTGGLVGRGLQEVNELGSGSVQTANNSSGRSADIATSDCASSIARSRMGVLIGSGSIRIGLAGFDGSPLPIANTIFKQMQLGFEWRGLSSTTTEFLLGTVESWDLRQQTRIVVPRRKFDFSAPYSKSPSSWYPVEVEATIQSLAHSSDEECFNHPLPHCIAMRYSQEYVHERGATKVKFEMAASGFDYIVDGLHGCFISCLRFWRPPEEVDELLNALGNAAALRVQNLRKSLQTEFLQHQEAMQIFTALGCSRIIFTGTELKRPAICVNISKLSLTTKGVHSTTLDQIALQYCQYILSFGQVSAELENEAQKATTASVLVQPCEVSLSVDVLQKPELVESNLLDLKAAREMMYRVKVNMELEIDAMVRQVDYWGLLRLYNIFFAKQSDARRAKVVTYAVVIGQQMYRFSRAPRAKSPLADLHLTLLNKRSTMTLLKHDESFAYEWRLGGWRCELSLNAENVEISTSVCSLSLSDCSNEDTVPLLLFSEPSPPLSEKSIHVKYTYNAGDEQQDVQLHCMFIQGRFDQERVVQIARFFYVDAFSAQEDPFTVAGTTAPEAALLLKSRAQTVVNSSKRILSTRGDVHFEAKLFAVQLLVVSRERGDVALMNARNLVSTVQWMRDGHTRLAWKTSQFSLHDLTTDIEEHRDVLTYVNNRAESSALFSAFLPSSVDQMSQLTGSLNGVHVVYTTHFAYILFDEFRKARDDLAAIQREAGEVRFAELLDDEIQLSKRVIPRFEVKVSLVSVQLLLPRNSGNGHEALVVRWNAFTVNSHQASEGYNFAFNARLEGVAAIVLYPEGNAVQPTSQTMKMDHARPCVQNVDVAIKLDWWREKSVRHDDAGLTLPEGQLADAHTRLPPFRVRWTVPTKLDIHLCEAQYTVLFFVLTENFSEPVTISPEEDFLDTGVDNVGQPSLKELQRSSQPPFLQILFKLPVLRLLISSGALPNNVRNAVLTTDLTDVSGCLSLWPDFDVDIDADAKLQAVVDETYGGLQRSVLQQYDSSERMYLLVSRPYTGPMAFKLRAPKIRFVVVPEFIARIFDLTVPGYVYLSTSTEGAEVPFAGYSCQLKMDDFEAWMYAEQGPDDRRALLTRGSITLSQVRPPLSDDSIAKVAAEGFEVLLVGECQINEDGHESASDADVQKTPLVFPLTLEMEHRYIADQDSSAVTMGVDSLLCRIAVDDASLVLAVVTRMLSLSWSAADTANENKAFPSVCVTLTQARLMFTDESVGRYLPIMEVYFTEGSLQARFPKVFTLSTTATASLFDSSRGCWVLGVEPWRVQFSLSGTLTEQTLVLASDGELALNVTPTTVGGVLHVAKVLRLAIQSSHGQLEDGLRVHKAKRPSVAAFCVRNETGLTFTLTHGGDEIRTLQEGRELEIHLSKEELMRTGGATARAENSRMQCVVRIGDSEPISLSVAEAHVDIKRVRHAANNGLSDVCSVVWEVIMRNGIPFGTLRSLYRLENCCNIPLQVRCVADAGPAKGEHVQLVKPNGIWNLPLPLIDQEFNVRPVTSVDDRAWSDPIRMPDMLARAMALASRDKYDRKQHFKTHRRHEDDEEPRITMIERRRRAAQLNKSAEGARGQLLCCPSASDAFYLALRWQVLSSTMVPIVGLNRHWLHIRLCAPLALFNSLPKPIVYRIRSLGSGNESTEEASLMSSTKEDTLQPLDRAYVYKVTDNFADKRLSVAYENFTLSLSNTAEPHFGEEVNLGDNEESLSSSLLLPVWGLRPGDTPLRVAHGEDSMGPYLNLWAKFWVRNRSDVDFELHTWSAAGVRLPRRGTWLLRAREPSSKSDEPMCIAGSHLFLAVAGRGAENATFVDLSSVHHFTRLQLAGASLLLQVELATDKMQSTFVATILNALWLENATRYRLQWCESSALDSRGCVATSRVHSLAAGRMESVHISGSVEEAELSVRLADDDGQSQWFWSQPVRLDLSDIVPAKMYHPKTNEQYIARLRTLVVLDCVRKVVVYEEDVAHPPYLIRNSCATRWITFRQENVSSTASNSRPWLLKSNTQSRYSWDAPHLAQKERRLAVQVLSGTESGGTNSDVNGGYGDGGHNDARTVLHSFELKIDEVQQAVYGVDESTEVLLVDVTVEGPTKVVTFTDLDNALSGSRSTAITPDAANASTWLDDESVAQTLGWDDFVSAAEVSPPLSPEDASPMRRMRTSPTSPTSAPTPQSQPLEAINSANFALISTFLPAGLERLNIIVNLPLIGVSLVDLTPQEILYARTTDAKLKMDVTPHAQTLSFTVNDLQIDNQLPNAVSAVALWSPKPREERGSREAAPQSTFEAAHAGASNEALDGEPSELSVADERRPFIELRLCQCKDPRWDTFRVVESLYFALQDVQVNVDEQLAWSVVQSFGAMLSADSTSTDDLNLLGDDRAKYVELLARGSTDELDSLLRVYIAAMIVCPARVTVSFSAMRSSLFRMLGRRWGGLSALLSALGNVEDAEFRFRALELRHAFGTSEHLRHLFYEFYFQQLLAQKYTLLTSNKLLGNPSALFDSISTGTRDFFVEPSKASSSSEFFRELARGSASLLENAFGGLVISAGSIPAMMSLGLENVVADQLYLSERADIWGRDRFARTPMDGLVRGARSFGHGVTSGLLGLFLDPYLGAVEEGASGFFRGLGRGVVGGVIKPLTGALDLVSEPTTGLHTMVNTFRRGQEFNGEAMRPPRTFEQNRLVQFDLYRAIGQAALRAVDITEDVLEWTLLSVQVQPTVAELWSLWAEMRAYARGESGDRRPQTTRSAATNAAGSAKRDDMVGRTGFAGAPGDNAEPDRDEDARSESAADREEPNTSGTTEDEGGHEEKVLAITTTSQLAVITLTATLVWSCPLDHIIDVCVLEDDGVVQVGVKPVLNKAEIYWPSIACGTVEAMKCVESSLRVALRLRSRWPNDRFLLTSSADGTNLSVVNMDRGDDDVGEEDDTNAIMLRSPTATPARDSRAEPQQQRHNRQLLARVSQLRESPSAHSNAARRSVRIIVANHSSRTLATSKLYLGSGTWRRTPRDTLAPLDADVCEAESGAEYTSDIHGSLLYHCAEDADHLVHLSFSNLFLARNDFIARAQLPLQVHVDDRHLQSDHGVVVVSISSDDLAVT